MSGRMEMPADVRSSLEPIIKMGISEDLGDLGDVTTKALIDPGLRGCAEISSKSDLVICGVEAAGLVFQNIDSNISFDVLQTDGSESKAGDLVAVARGVTRSLLMAERTALNIMQHLTGIATLTRSFVQAVQGSKSKIVDTRKTTPGWRLAEKWAVRVGGGGNHRLGLYDAVLIKENHIEPVGSVQKAIDKAREGSPKNMSVEIEVTSFQELEEAVAAKPDAILLDNMDVSQLTDAVKRVRELVGDTIVLEASGGMTLGKISEVAASGVDIISVGALTHSAPAADLSMKISTANGTDA